MRHPLLWANHERCGSENIPKEPASGFPRFNQRQLRGAPDGRMPEGRRLSIRVCCLLLCLALQSSVFAWQQQFGEIGDLELVSGEVLRGCILGYRTFGQISADKSNVIVYPTWANGRTEQMESSAAWLRDAGYFVIAIGDSIFAQASFLLWTSAGK